MSTATALPPDPATSSKTASPEKHFGFGQKRLRRVPLAAHGQPQVWLAGGMLAICSAMVIGLLFLILVRGLATFWPGPVVSFTTVDGQVTGGEVTRLDYFKPGAEVLAALSPAAAAAADQLLAVNEGISQRQLVRIGNFELTGKHFAWISDFMIAQRNYPEWAIVLERLTWGRFYGEPKAFLIDGHAVAQGPEATWAKFKQHHGPARERWRQIQRLQRKELGRINHYLERSRLQLREAQFKVRQALERHGPDSNQYHQALTALARQELEFTTRELQGRQDHEKINRQIDQIKQQNLRYRILMSALDGQEQLLGLADIVRAYPANQLGLAQKIGVYLDRWVEFLRDEPREANSEGGVLPAIFGTVVITLMMCLFVTPFGILAALYIREYAKDGPLISAIRIAVNNLAGVPSIVWGVFGLGFFVYLVGGSIDQLFFAAELPSPTFGSGGVFWASLTLALLALPVMIVATEEALAAVPSSLREGSYASGASKWQTIQRIVLPQAMPGIITGVILTIARGAGEVAPMMLVGVVKLAPQLPVDGFFPFVHLERSFMHLGFHIYDLGFQSQNSEATIPLAITTTLLLIAIIFILNIGAIMLRNRLRKKFIHSSL